MIYTKITTCQGYAIEIPLDEGIFSNCNQCCKEMKLDGEDMFHILEEGDLATTKILCGDCTANKFK